jgi:hypothetical protein
MLTCWFSLLETHWLLRLRYAIGLGPMIGRFILLLTTTGCIANGAYLFNIEGQASHRALSPSRSRKKLSEKRPGGVNWGDE